MPDFPDGTSSALLKLALLTAQIHRVVVLVHQRQAVRIYGRKLLTDSLELKLLELTLYEGQEGTEVAKVVHLLMSKPNYEGKTLVNTVCRGCGGEIEQFRKTGKWHAFTKAAIYYLGLHINATIKFVKPLTGWEKMSTGGGATGPLR